MVKQASLISDLESIVGADSIVPPERTADFAVDGLTPHAAVAPATVEQVGRVLRFAHSQGLAVIPWGGGTMMHVGNLPARYDIALSLLRLDKVIEHEPADLTATVQAGMTLGNFQERLGRAGQFLALDPPHGQQATIGGILAANASGPWRHAYGSARDITIGLRVVTADGRITKAGGKVVKNVAGYDLCKLYIGSLGTLGVIVEATFKLAPLPKAEYTLVAPFHHASNAFLTTHAFQQQGLALNAVALLNRVAAGRLGSDTEDQPYLLALRFAGTSAAVERSLKEVELPTKGVDFFYQADAQLWERINELMSPKDVDVLCKISLLPSHLASLIEAFEATKSPPYIVALPTVGVMYMSWPEIGYGEENIVSLRDAISPVAGTLVVAACSAALKQRIDVFGDPPPSFDLMRRIKGQFDPKGILSPGRFLGRL